MRGISPGIAASVVAVALLAATLAACSGDESPGAGSQSRASSASATVTGRAPDPGEEEGAAGAATGSAVEGECSYVPNGARPARPVQPPPPVPSAAGPTEITLRTTAGRIAMTLLPSRAPCAVNSFLSLADQGYFDGTDCHRLVTRSQHFLVCGDPSGTGGGGPGYIFADELRGNERYGAGTVAMTNAGPGTNGSQFMLVYARSPLPKSYTVFGRIQRGGLATLRKVAKAGTGHEFGQGDGTPAQRVRIRSVVR